MSLILSICLSKLGMLRVLHYSVADQHLELPVLTLIVGVAKHDYLSAYMLGACTICISTIYHVVSWAE